MQDMGRIMYFLMSIVLASGALPVQPELDRIT